MYIFDVTSKSRRFSLGYFSFQSRPWLYFNINMKLIQQQARKCFGCKKETFLLPLAVSGLR
jgi:hypothetical protein